VWAFAIGALIGQAAGAAGLAGIELHARALAPGEPVRVVALSAEPLAALRGEFLGQPVHLSRDPRSSLPERWTGWTLVPLDQPPVSAALDLRGSTVAGEEVLGTVAARIEAKTFPEEQLSVAPRYVTPPEAVLQRLEAERRRLAEIYERRSPILLGGAPFVRPVGGDQTSVFGTRRLYNGEPRSPHPGIDLRAATGTLVRAAGPGEVVLATDLYYSGKTVILDHGGGLFTLYAHLSELRVAEGERVAAAQPVGLAGATGRVTGPHLHWGAKIADRPFDPAALLDPLLFP